MMFLQRKKNPSLVSVFVYCSSYILTGFVLLLYLTAGKAAAQIISATGVAMSVPAPGIQTEEGEKDHINMTKKNKIL